MKIVKLETQHITFILIALFIGFIGGAVFAVYKLPNVMSESFVQKRAQAMEAERHIEHMKEEVAKHSDNAESWTKLGNAYYDAGKFDEAIETYTKSLALSPDRPDVLTDMGTMYWKKKEPLKAIELFDRASVVDPTHIHAKFNKGVVLYQEMNDTEGAIKAFQLVADLQPDFPVSSGQTIGQLIENIKADSATNSQTEQTKKER